jgi:hypothetical protein
MVGRDMLTRLRLVLCVLAALAVLALAGLGGAPAPARAEGPGATEHGSALMAVTRAPVTAGALDGAPRRLPILAVLAAIALVAILLAATPTRKRGLVGRHRRRVGDAGEGWRALLLGAPPAAA